MKIKHTANEKLDGVLKVLNSASLKLIQTTDIVEMQGNPDTLDELKIQFALINIEIKDVDLTELKLILSFLLDEKYIYNEHWGYRILYTGKVFIENGGYTKAEKRRLILSRMGIIISLATVLGVIAAGAYGCFEIWKYYYGYVPTPK